MRLAIIQPACADRLLRRDGCARRHADQRNEWNGLTLAGEQNLAGKILIDVSNPLDFTNGFPASLMELLRSFGWIHIFDLGNLSTALGTEAYLLLWVRLYGTMNTGMINVKIMK